MNKTSPQGGKTMAPSRPNSDSDSNNENPSRPIYDVSDTPTPLGWFKVISREDPYQKEYCSHTTWIAAWRCAKFGECTRKGNGKGRV